MPVLYTLLGIILFFVILFSLKVTVIVDGADEAAALEDIEKFPYRPKYIFNGVGDIVK